MDIETLAIEYLKSGLSVNTHIGCGLGCTYCVLSTGVNDFPNKSVYVNSPKKIIEKLNDPMTMFVNGLTPIYVNNRTDPFLPNVADSTYELLNLLVSYCITSPIIIISKLTPDGRFRDLTSALNILYFYTYSGLTGIDYNSDDKINKKSLELILKNVPLENRFHYFRPVIPAYNDGEAAINNILGNVKGIFRLTVSGGIRLNIENSKRFGVFEYDKNHKFFSDNVWSIILQQSQTLQLSVVRHTSCAIAIFMNRPNNFHYFNKHDHCIGSSCKCYELCKQERMPDRASIDAFLSKRPAIKYYWDDNMSLLVKSPISQEVLAFLKSTYGIHCVANEIILSPSESQITK